MGGIFDFSKRHSAGTKFLNVMAVTTVDLLWLFFVVCFLGILLGFSGENIANVMTPLSLKIAPSNMFSLDDSPAYLFFAACIMAPLWEEYIFREMAIKLAINLSQRCKMSNGSVVFSCEKQNIIYNLAIGSAIIFGLLHGYGIISILIQGVAGMLFAWLYLKNNNSYWSCVAAHAIWNFLVIFGLPVVMSSIVR